MLWVTMKGRVEANFVQVKFLTRDGYRFFVRLYRTQPLPSLFIFVVHHTNYLPYQLSSVEYKIICNELLTDYDNYV